MLAQLFVCFIILEFEENNKVEIISLKHKHGQFPWALTQSLFLLPPAWSQSPLFLLRHRHRSTKWLHLSTWTRFCSHSTALRLLIPLMIGTHSQRFATWLVFCCCDSILILSSFYHLAKLRLCWSTTLSGPSLSPHTAVAQALVSRKFCCHFSGLDASLSSC